MSNTNYPNKVHVNAILRETLVCANFGELTIKTHYGGINFEHFNVFNGEQGI